jgi:hypothetical protein
MKLLLSLLHYRTIYLIVKLSRINLMFEDCFIFIGPFIDTPSIISWILNIFATH